MKNKTVLALAFMLLITPYSYGYNATTENMLDVARKNYAAGRIQPAIDAYWKVLERTPEKLIAHLELGEIYRRIKMYDRAVELLEPALKNAALSNMDSEILCKYYCCLTATFMSLKNEGKANQYLIKAAQIAPKNPRPRVLLGDIYKSKGKYSNAEKAYRQALQLDSNFKLAADKLAALIRDFGDKLEKTKIDDKPITSSKEIITMPNKETKLKVKDKENLVSNSKKNKKKKKIKNNEQQINIIEQTHFVPEDDKESVTIPEEAVYAYPGDEVPIGHGNEEIENEYAQHSAESDQYYIDMLVGGEMHDKEKAVAYFVHEGKKGLNKIEDLLYNADPNVRLIAVRAMSRFTDCKKHVKLILQDAEDDSNSDVAAEIKSVLYSLEDVKLDD